MDKNGNAGSGRQRGTDMKLSLRGRRPSRISALGVIAALVASTLAFVATTAGASHTTGPGFEVDAGQSEGWAAGTAGTPRALWSNAASHTDWADGGPGDGFFTPSAATPHTAAADCYNSNIDFVAGADAVLDFICDGHSDSKFSGRGASLANEPEKNIVSPAGKTLDDVWPIKTGNNTPKDDFTHAYNAFVYADSKCDVDTDADDLFLIAGANRGDNEGTQFWGAEFNQKAPAGSADLLNNSGNTFNLDFDRTSGDLLTIFDNSSGGNTIDIKVARWDGTTYQEQTPTGCTQDPGTDGDSDAQTNGDGDDATNDAIEAPPWNVPTCDPTIGDGNAGGTGNKNNNGCRLARGTPTSTGRPTDHLIAERDFFEAVVDLGAYGIPPTCFTSLVFTSRSSDTINADLKDVAGASVELCSLDIQKFIDKNQNGAFDSATDLDTQAELPAGTATQNDLTGWLYDVYRDNGTTPGAIDAGDTLVCNDISTDADGKVNCPVSGTGNHIIQEVNTGAVLGTSSVASIVTTANPVTGVDPQGGAVVRFGNTCRITKTFRVTGVPAGVTALSAFWDVTTDVNSPPATGASADGSITLSDAGNGTSDDGIWQATTTRVFDIGDILSWTYGPSASDTKPGGNHTFVIGDAYPACTTRNDVVFSPGSVTGEKYKDAAGDGAVDPADLLLPLQGWEFKVTGPGLPTAGTLIYTDSSGQYTLGNLAPGTYTIDETGKVKCFSGATVTECAGQAAGTIVTVDNWQQTLPASNGTRTATLTLGEDEDVDEFLNAPESRFDVRFYDLTGSTDADVDCVKTGTTNEVESATTGSESTTPESTTTSDDVLPGSYTCTLVITDP